MCPLTCEEDCSAYNQNCLQGVQAVFNATLDADNPPPSVLEMVAALFYYRINGANVELQQQNV